MRTLNAIVVFLFCYQGPVGLVTSYTNFSTNIWNERNKLIFQKRVGKKRQQSNHAKILSRTNNISER